MHERLLVLLKLTLTYPIENFLRIYLARVLVETALTDENHSWELLVFGLPILEDAAYKWALHAVDSANQGVILGHVRKFGELCGPAATLATLQVCEYDELVLAAPKDGIFPGVHADLYNFEGVFLCLISFIFFVLIWLGLTVSKGK